MLKVQVTARSSRRKARQSRPIHFILSALLVLGQLSVGAIATACCSCIPLHSIALE
jgi:hypothetical protein